MHIWFTQRIEENFRENMAIGAYSPLGWNRQKLFLFSRVIIKNHN